jgi:hypothetical protein
MLTNPPTKESVTPPERAFGMQLPEAPLPAPQKGNQGTEDRAQPVRPVDNRFF